MLQFLVLTVLLLVPASSSAEESATLPGRVVEHTTDIDGWVVDPSAFDDVIEEHEGPFEEAPDQSTRHPFAKHCPYGYWKCDNDECIANRWRCDGHFDCDDFSDEINCTSLDLPHQPILYVPPVTRPNISQPHYKIPNLEFNSSIEPLMIFSTGTSIRGLWLKSKIYFDIASRNTSQATTQPSITDAFSLFFGGLFQAPPSAPVTASPTPKPASAGPPKRKTTIVGLDMDPANKEVFWVELGKEPGVYSVPLDDNVLYESRHRRSQIQDYKRRVNFELLAPEDIALDTVGRNVYITDAGIPAIVACSYVNGHCKIIVTIQLHKPRAIIADSSTGWVTFTDWGDRPGIYLTSMDGRRFETLIESDVVWPNGLAHDPSSDSLFWADARLNKIERVDLKTRERYIVIREQSTNPFSLSLFENRIYWSDWSKNEIKTCNKFKGNDTQVVIHVDDIYGIHIYHPDYYKDEQANPCWAKRCSHMCLLSPSSAAYASRASGGLKATCACPENMHLTHLDRSTCYRHSTHRPRPQTPSQPTQAPVTHHDAATDHKEETTSHEHGAHHEAEPHHEVHVIPDDAIHHVLITPPSHPQLDADTHRKPRWTSTTNQPARHHDETTPKLIDHETPKPSEITSEKQPESNKIVWLIVFLLILSATGLVTVLSLFVLHKQGRLPPQVSVSFVSPNRAADKDRAMLLLDTDN